MSQTSYKQRYEFLGILEAKPSQSQATQKPSQADEAKPKPKPSEANEPSQTASQASKPQSHAASQHRRIPPLRPVRGTLRGPPSRRLSESPGGRGHEEYQEVLRF